MSEDQTMPEAAQAFAAHFTDPIYEDSSDERSPFGSDHGADMLATWAERRGELGPQTTVADVLQGDPDEFLESKSLDDALELHGAGFTLLRLTGRIDADGKRATLAALEQLLSPEMFGDDPVLARQRDDLQAWAD